MTTHRGSSRAVDGQFGHMLTTLSASTHISPNNFRPPGLPDHFTQGPALLAPLPENDFDRRAVGCTVADSSAQFAFSSMSGASFECKLDAGAWGAHLAFKMPPGLYLLAEAHTFEVAVDRRRPN